MYINKRIYGIKNEIMSLYENFLSIKKDRDFPPAFLFILYFFTFISSTHTKNTTILSIPFLNFG